MSHHDAERYPEYNTPEILEALRLHGLATRVPSQLSDSFRHGYRAALAQHAARIIRLERNVVAQHEIPIDMILYCPNCGVQHVDAADADNEQTIQPAGADVWTNPPHRSHLCDDCGIIWRPADVPTNGVAEIKTHGHHDTWPAHNEEINAQPAQQGNTK